MKPDLAWIQRTQEQTEAAVVAALSTKRTVLDTIIALPAGERTFSNTVAALETSNDELSDLQQQLQVLAAVHPDRVTRDACQETADRIATAIIDMEYDPRLWQAVQEWLATREKLDAVDRKLADDVIRDMRRMGFDLPPERFERLKKNQQELQALEREFEKTINEYSDFIAVTKEELDGMSERYIQGLHVLPDGYYRISLEYPDMFPYLQYATDAAKREELAHKQLLRGGFENMERLAHMVRLRQEGAGLLGYASHADFAGQVRMAGSAQAIEEFLRGLMEKLLPAAKKELKELVAVKKEQLGLEHPAPIHYHEAAYWSERLRRERYNLDAEKVKEYFPLTRVIDGMFRLYQDLLGVRFTAVPDAALWHPDARTFVVTDAENGAELGHFFLDLHPRDGKYGHAAAMPCIVGRGNGAVTGLIALVCNFPKPTAQNPSLLAHDDVEALLHEFGHVMHALLSGGRYQRQNGFGVPLDFVEALSQIFEYWAWDPRVLGLLSGHYTTGASLPKELLDTMLAARRHQEARWYLAQAMRSLYDIRIHGQPPDAPVSAQQLAQQYRDMALEYLDIDLPDDAIFAAGWDHMADYDAGYYGYLWSKVYAADMFTRFAPDPLNAAVGRDYRTKVLAPGAGKKEHLLVEEFLGRPSTNVAFLAELGIS